MTRHLSINALVAEAIRDNFHAPLDALAQADEALAEELRARDAQLETRPRQAVIAAVKAWRAKEEGKAVQEQGH